MSLKKRLERLEGALSVELEEGEAERVLYCHNGEVLEFSPEEWREYKRSHPDLETITIREVEPEDEARFASVWGRSGSSET